ncbi:tyrosine-type recombinase/integrase [Clostridium butyricum]
MNENNNRLRYLTQDELRNLFYAIETYSGHNSLRDLAIFRVSYRCGLRATEISLIKFDDYSIRKSELYCKRLKGSRNNTIRLDLQTKNVLEEYISQKGIYNSDEIIFKSQKNNPISRKTLDYLMKKYCKLAKIDDVSKHHFHTIKHTTAVHLADSEMDIKEIQWWLGHKSVNNTEIYFQFTSKQQERMYTKLEEIGEMI